MKDHYRWVWWSAVFSCLMMGAGCSHVPGRVHKGSVDSVINQRPNRLTYFESIGMGAADPRLATETQRKALARDAAIVKAQYEMLSMLKGVALEGGVSISQAMESDSRLEAKVNDTIRGAEIWKSEFTSDNGCVVTIRLPKQRLERLMGVRFQ